MAEFNAAQWLSEMTWRKHIRTSTKAEEYHFLTPAREGVHGMPFVVRQEMDRRANLGKFGVLIQPDRIAIEHVSYYPEEARFADLYYARERGTQRNRYIVQYEAPRDAGVPTTDGLYGGRADILEDVYDATSGRDASHQSRFNPGKGTASGTDWDKHVEREGANLKGAFLIDETGKFEAIKLPEKKSAPPVPEHGANPAATIETAIENEKWLQRSEKTHWSAKTAIIGGTVLVVGALGYWAFHAKHTKDQATDQQKSV